MKIRNILLFLFVIVLLFPGCAKNQMQATEPILSTTFWQMTEQELHDTLTAQGWSTFEDKASDSTYFIGMFLDAPANLCVEYDGQSGLVSSLRFVSVYRPESDQATVDDFLATISETAWDPLRQCQYYDENAQKVMARWLSKAKTAAQGCGTIAETGTIRLSSSDQTELEKLLQSYFEADYLQFRFGERYYTLSSGCFCSFDISAIRLDEETARMSAVFTLYSPDYVSAEGATPQLTQYPTQVDSAIDVTYRAS